MIASIYIAPWECALFFIFLCLLRDLVAVARRVRARVARFAGRRAGRLGRWRRSASPASNRGRLVFSSGADLPPARVYDQERDAWDAVWAQQHPSTTSRVKIIRERV